MTTTESTASRLLPPSSLQPSANAKRKKASLTLVAPGAKAKPDREALQKKLRQASGYAEWAAAAMALDELSGGAQWKAQESCDLYDHKTIRRRLNQFRAARRRNDNHGLLFALEEGVHGNLGGMGKPSLYNQAKFGTKQLITDYIDAVSAALLHVEKLPDSEIPWAAKLDLFERASHCFGRSAMMFSGGGALVYFHFGVVKSLLEQGLLPNVLSGSSAGSIVCAVLGTRSDAELGEFLNVNNVSIGKPWQPNKGQLITGLRPLVSAEEIEHSFAGMIPDLTFREAYEISGRHISISVSPTERHHSPRLLNATTSPHVLIRSAVRASCALPGFFKPVQLMARNAHGNPVPYLNSRWMDGVVAADLPAKQLARLYGTNHYIVSLINPIILPMFRDIKLTGTTSLPLLDMIKRSAQHYLGAVDSVLAKIIPDSSLVTANKMLHNIVSQHYQGDINIVPRNRLFSPFRLLSPFTPKEVEAMVREGERQTWPRLEMIRNTSKISRTLDEILSRSRKAGLNKA